MAQQNQILLTIYRDRYAPFDPSLGKSVYSPPKGYSFNVDTIKGICNVVESGVTYGSFLYHETDGEPRSQVLVTQASGAIITLCNA